MSLSEMTNKEVALRALEIYRGDDFARMTEQFRRLAPEQLDQPYGESGQTYAEVYSGAAARDRKIRDAMYWVNQCPE